MSAPLVEIAPAPMTVSVVAVGPPLGPVVDVSTGQPLTITWAAVPGADGVSVAGCPLVIAPQAFEQSRPDQPIAAQGNSVVVTLPAGEDLKALALGGVTRVDG